jgi:hypothetical protein
MKLFLLTRPDSCGYDEYDSAVVAAVSRQAAAKTNPSGSTEDGGSWVPLSKVKVEYLGAARRGTKAGVICASFNAG